MNRFHPVSIESLESRTFLSVAVQSSHLAAPSSAATVTTVIPTVTGPTLRAIAGVQFSGVVGFYASPPLSPPLAYSATINWGDGGNSAATLAYGQYNGQNGYLISGTHTFVKPGVYSVKTTLFVGPTNGSLVPTQIVEYIVDSAAVISTNGVFLNEIAGKAFTASLGTFTTTLPVASLIATITWGDGTTSIGTITPIVVAGTNIVKYSVSGAHTYKLAGADPIHIVISQPAVAGSSAAPVVVATIDSAAIVTPPIVA